MAVHARLILEVPVLSAQTNTNVLVLLLGHSEGLGNCFIKKGEKFEEPDCSVVENLSKNLDRDVRQHFSDWVCTARYE